MAQSFFVLDFGKDEDAAQSARRKVDAWKQGFRLGNKMLLKFDRKDEGGSATEASVPEAVAKKNAKPKRSTLKAGSQGSEPSSVRVLLKLDFSDHEKLSHQRWLDRIPAEDPFSAAKLNLIRSGDSRFSETAEHFDALE